MDIEVDVIAIYWCQRKWKFFFTNFAYSWAVGVTVQEKRVWGDDWEQRCSKGVSCLEHEDFLSGVPRYCAIERYVQGGIRGLSSRVERRGVVQSLPWLKK